MPSLSKPKPYIIAQEALDAQKYKIPPAKYYLWGGILV